MLQRTMGNHTLFRAPNRLATLLVPLLLLLGANTASADEIPIIDAHSQVEVAHAVAHRNAERLWRLPAAR